MSAAGRALAILASVTLLLSSCATEPQKPVEPIEQPEQQPAAQPEGQPTPQPAQAQSYEFVATEEMYKKTFDEVEEVVAALTRIIAAGDYDTWTTYLTAEYVRVTGSPEFLDAVSESNVLKKNGIVLKNLKDYFNNVVVRSRVEATLDSITFVDATHVKAITKIKDTPVILYYLVREDGRWKVGIIEHAKD